MKVSIEELQRLFPNLSFTEITESAGAWQDALMMVSPEGLEVDEIIRMRYDDTDD